MTPVNQLAQCTDACEVEAVRTLIEEDPSLARQQNHEGLSALCQAIALKQQDCFDVLLPHSDLSQGNPAGQSPLMMAIYFGRDAMVPPLLEHSDLQRTR